MLVDQSAIEIRYLLGKLSEEEKAEVESGYFVDKSNFENILVAETSLLDAYVSEDLSAEDRGRFEQRLLLNPRQLSRAKFAEALQQYLLKSQLNELGIEHRAGIWSSVSNFLSTPSMLALSFAAALIIGIGVAVLLLQSRTTPPPDMARTDAPAPQKIGPVNTAPEPQNSVSEIATSAASKPTQAVPSAPPKTAAEKNPSRQPVVATILLQFSATRGSEPSNTFTIPEKATHIDIIIAVEENEHKSYIAVIETAEGQQIWRGKATISGGQGKERARIRVPADRMKAGDYIVSLSARSENGLYDPVVDHSFTIREL